MLERRKIERRTTERRKDTALQAQAKELKELRNTIFNMLNFTNMYALVLDENMIVRFANDSLAIDLGLEGYKELLGQCWIDFIGLKDRNMISNVHTAVAYGTPGWEDEFREVQNIIRGRKGEIEVAWFNSHINTDYNWTFSFGIKKNHVVEEKVDVEEISMEELREYYQDIVTKDRIMINAMRDVIGLRDKIVDTCKPNFVEINNARSLSV